MISARPYGTLDIVVAVTALVVLAGLFLPGLWRSRQWRATVTPLASIIGSGFLIIAPLLHSILGRWALAGIAFLSVLSYAVGSSIRFNIIHAENWKDERSKNQIKGLEFLSQATLGLAYTVSVAFYSSLFIAFLFERFSIDQPNLQPLATTALLLGVGSVAWWHGTKGLETVELLAVTLKLSIIAAVLVALAVYDINTGTVWFRHSATAELSFVQTIAVLAGLLMVTQGFETTRFMGDHYDPETRVRAAQYSQWIAIIIYVAFIGITCPLFLTFPITVLTETTVSSTLGQAIYILPLALFIAATASQLSAALADTIGGGGLLAEIAPYRLSERTLYGVVVAVAVAIIWSFDVFGIINIASKGFAAFYLLQVLITKKILIQERHLTIFSMKVIGCWILIIILGFVIVGSIPAPHG